MHKKRKPAYQHFWRLPRVGEDRRPGLVRKGVLHEEGLEVPEAVVANLGLGQIVGGYEYVARRKVTMQRGMLQAVQEVHSTGKTKIQTCI